MLLTLHLELEPFALVEGRPDSALTDTFNAEVGSCRTALLHLGCDIGQFTLVSGWIREVDIHTKGPETINVDNPTLLKVSGEPLGCQPLLPDLHSEESEELRNRRDGDSTLNALACPFTKDRHGDVPMTNLLKQLLKSFLVGHHEGPKALVVLTLVEYSTSGLGDKSSIRKARYASIGAVDLDRARESDCRPRCARVVDRLIVLILTSVGRDVTDLTDYVAELVNGGEWDKWKAHGFTVHQLALAGQVGSR